MFERLLEPGCTESPACQCGADMEIASIEVLPEGSDAAIRVSMRRMRSRDAPHRMGHSFTVRRRDPRELRRDAASREFIRLAAVAKTAGPCWVWLIHVGFGLPAELCDEVASSTKLNNAALF